MQKIQGIMKLKRLNQN